MYSYKLEDFTFRAEENFFVQYGWHNEDFLRHTHSDFTELTIVLSGEAVHMINQEEFKAKKGDVFVIPDRTEHGFRQVHDFRVCNIMYRQEMISFENKDIRENAGYQSMFCIEPYYTQSSSYKHHLHLSERDFAETEYLVQQLMKEYHGEQGGRKTMVELLFQQLAVELSRCYGEQMDREDMTGNRIKLAQSISYLEQHYLEEISIEKLARDAGYSQRHFIRLFKEIYHTTPLEYIISMRISHACRCLKNSTTGVADIAADSGFSNCNYFYRMFKKRVGMSPGEYRNL